EAWHLVVEFKAGTSTGQLIGGTAITMLGTGLLGVIGLGIVGNGVDGDNYYFDCRDLSTAEVTKLRSPPADLPKKLGPFIAQYEAEDGRRVRKVIASNGATHCKICNTFFVPSEEKRWTLLGFSSKLCCAESYGTTSYNQVEQQVLDATASLAPALKEFRQEASFLTIDCTCGNTFELPKNYAGLIRKCPSCGMKIRAPLE
ncbi:MAG: hypothetical protein ACR2NZ_19000, partial [Rubripirellula sp.]